MRSEYSIVKITAKMIKIKKTEGDNDTKTNGISFDIPLYV